MNAYIDTDTKNWLNKETVFRGLNDLGAYVDFIHKDDLKQEQDAIYYGNVGFIDHIANIFQYPKRPIAHVPLELQRRFAGRNIDSVLLSEALAQSKKELIFIKPRPSRHKEFTGLVLNNNSALIDIANYPLDEYVLMSPALNILSEWRCFVLDNEIIDAKHYKGDFRISPDWDVAMHAAKAWSDSPSAWSLDVGITDRDNTIVIECNDVMSLGMYGLSTAKAAALLVSRWEQIHYRKSF